jgi:excisionase family DNA binding protein
MRHSTFETLVAAEDDRLLTTGEAAKLLNSSRQHVVDLCERGELPFTTVGIHRRVRRGDVEAVRTRTQRLTRDQQRSLWLAYAIAGRIVADPERARNMARVNLEHMHSASRGQTQRWLDEWDKLLDGPLDTLLATLTSRSPKGREMRQNSPFAGLLEEAERGHILKTWQEEHALEHS